MGRYEEALADYDRAVEMDPQYAWARGSTRCTSGPSGAVPSSSSGWAGTRRRWPTTTAPS
uniref:tetratricopeptide repeat protein n=1 Tax=Streptomyces flavovirens TaxID=52258 RepID=UPI002277393A